MITRDNSREVRVSQEMVVAITTARLLLSKKPFYSTWTSRAQTKKD